MVNLLNGLYEWEDTISKAESIDIIESDTAAAHKIALNQYQGTFTKPYLNYADN